MAGCSKAYNNYLEYGFSLMQYAGIFLLLSFFTVAGCQPSSGNHSDIELHWQIMPHPPAVGEAIVRIALTDSAGQTITGADIRLEGNMSHPGMQPIIVTAEEVSPGEYRAPIEFTMGGDWFILVESTLPDKRIVKRQINVSGVRSE